LKSLEIFFCASASSLIDSHPDDCLYKKGYKPAQREAQIQILRGTMSRKEGIDIQDSETADTEKRDYCW